MIEHILFAGLSSRHTSDSSTSRSFSLAVGNGYGSNNHTDEHLVTDCEMCSGRSVLCWDLSGLVGKRGPDCQGSSQGSGLEPEI